MSPSIASPGNRPAIDLHRLPLRKDRSTKEFDLQLEEQKLGKGRKMRGQIGSICLPVTFDQGTRQRQQGKVNHWPGKGKCAPSLILGCPVLKHHHLVQQFFIWKAKPPPRLG